MKEIVESKNTPKFDAVYCILPYRGMRYYNEEKERSKYDIK